MFMNRKYDNENAKLIINQRIGVYKNALASLETLRKQIFRTRKETQTGSCLLKH